MFETKYIKFGKRLGKELESGSISVDTKFFFSKFGLLEPGEYEKKYLVNYEGVPIVAYVDKIEQNGLVVHEYKTATQIWTDEKCKKHLQPELYCALISLSNDKFIDREVKLYVFETIEGKSGSLYFSGNFKAVERICTTEQQYKILEWVVERAVIISDYYKKWLK